MTTKTPHKPGKEVVYLDVDDDITTVVDKVEGAKDKIVALVLPKRFATLQSIVNMRLLKRSAKAADKSVVLITNEAALLPLAGAADIHVAKNLQSKPEIPPSPVDLPQEKPAIPEDPDAEVDKDAAKLDYHRSMGELAAAGTVDEPETIALDDAEDEEKEASAPAKARKDKKLKVPNFERFRLLLMAGVLGIVLLVVFIIMAVLVWPKAIITLQTEATPLSASFDLTTSGSAKKLNEKQGIIPAVLKKSTFTSNQQVDATGEKNNGDKASGNVDLTARKCSGSGNPKNVPAGTGVTANGLTYITQANTTFHFTSISEGCANFTADSSTSITAQSGGSKYNVSGAPFSVPGRSDVSGTGSASGGSDDIVTIVGQQDLDSAKNKISKDDTDSFVSKFKQKLDDGQLYILESTLKANKPDVTSSPAVGKPADSASVTIKITYTVLVIQKSDLKKAITDELNKQIDKTKQKIGTDDVLKDVNVNVQSQGSATDAALSISEQTTAVPIINVALIQNQVGGQKSGDIRAFLSGWPGVKNVEVKMSPFWVSKAPKKPSHIIVIEQQVTTKTSGS